MTICDPFKTKHNLLVLITGPPQSAFVGLFVVDLRSGCSKLKASAHHLLLYLEDYSITVYF